MAEIELKRKPYFYDSQIKRYLIVLMAIFAGYQVRMGTQRDGTRPFKDVPIVYGDYSQSVQFILADGTENIMPTLPIMSLYMTGLRQKAEWRHNPDHWEYFRYTSRKRDAEGNLLVNQPGKRVTIERYMPQPYDLDIEVSLWASNNDQLYQLLEQILVVFGTPQVDIQLRNSPADWIFLTQLIFQGEPRFENVAANLGGGANPDPYYVATLPFKAIPYFSPPAKVYTEKPIYEIHVPIEDLERILSECKEENGTVDFDSLNVIDGFVIRATPQEIANSESMK